MDKEEFAMIKFTKSEKLLLLEKYSSYILNDREYVEERILNIDPFHEIFCLYLQAEERKVVLYGLIDKYPENNIFKELLGKITDLNNSISKLTIDCD